MIGIVPGPRGRLHVDDGGPDLDASDGLPVVLVHGLAGSVAHYEPLLPLLRRTRRAVALDLPGMGSSERPRDDDHAIEANAEAVLAVADALGLTRFALAGHSYAGHVVAWLAAAEPRRVGALAFLDAGRYVPSAADLEELRVGFRPGAYARFVTRWFEEILACASASTRATVLAGLRATPRSVFVSTVYGSSGHDLRASAERYPGPKLAICAEAFGMAARWEGAPVEVQVLPGVSHWLALDAPEAVAAALDRFLSRAEGG